MIRINAPLLESKDGKTVLKAFIENDKENLSGWLWFATDIENGKFFCDEVADAFVLPMILRSVKSQQDIEVMAPMSEKLFYNLNDSVFYAVSKSALVKTSKYIGLDINGKEWGIPAIKCSQLVKMDFHPFAVGTGCSLGVDSFAVLKSNLFDKECPQSYKITHLTLFNAGAFGYTADDGAKESFFREVEKTKCFADKMQLPFVWIDSNIRSFYPEASFDWCHTYLNMGIVLSMQKLWSKYLYASGYSIEYFKLDINDSASSEAFLLPRISTENTELISASTNMRRSDKVKYIIKDEIVRENLYVCLKEQQANSPYHSIIDDRGFLNCGHCKKCKRTMLQLDVLGQTDEFKRIFDWSDWEKERIKYIAHVIAERNNNDMFHDLYASMCENHYAIPFRSKVYAFLYCSYLQLRKVWKS